MIDSMTTVGFSPLGIRIKGSGAYVTEQLNHLVDYFDYMKNEELEAIRQDAEND